MNLFYLKESKSRLLGYEMLDTFWVSIKSDFKHVYLLVIFMKITPSKNSYNS